MSPKKAFLLADGRARLGALTDATPQCLLPVGGRPLLHWWLRVCERLGVEQALLNTHHLAPQVREFVRTRTSSVKVTLYHEERPLGSAGTLAVNRHFVAGEAAFWILDAGVLAGGDLAPLAALFRARRADLARGLVEEPGAAPSPAGVYVAGPRLLDALPKLTGDLAADVYPKLADNACELKLERVIRLDAPQSYARAQREFPAFGLR